MRASRPSLMNRLMATLGLDPARPGLDLFPFRHALRASDGTTLRADLAAGLSVALLALPLAMAFATKAGLPIWSGILGAGLAALVAPLFAGSPMLSVGPTNASAALLVGTFAAAGGTSPEMRLALLPALLAMTAGFVLLAAWLRLGGFADFVPRTVIAAIIAAAAIRVLVLQLPVALGIRVDADGSPFAMLADIARGLPGVVNPDFAVGLASLIVFAVARSRTGLGTSILVSVAVGSFFAMVAENVALMSGNPTRQGLFAYVGAEASEPTALTPALAFHNFSTLFSPALALAVMVIIEGTANARASSLRLGRPANLPQELLGLGAANLACAAAGGMPASGSVSRSTLNIASGARTAVASVITGGALLGLAHVGGGLLAKIPLATLAMATIAVERELVNLPVVRTILRSGAEDRAVFLVTLATALIAPLDIAIFLGTAVAIGHYLRKTAVPKVVEYVFSEQGGVHRREAGLPSTGISILHVAGSLHFGATHAFHDHLRRVTSDPGVKVLVLKFREAEHLDADGVLLLSELGENLARDGRHLILCELGREALDTLRACRLTASLPAEHLVEDDAANPTASLARALRLAHRLTGGAETVVRVVATEGPGPSRAASSHLDWEI
ncbi:MAG: SulP family inorganic anion transporter [Opitutia bacterium]